ncbi:pilus assembly protein [Hydrogenophaga sp.]|uniref:pilus assembly protein n=1 Tax=Hydrogenophaga sp. TaxID=1904254 RepID=UPI002718DD5B|nr:PilC/PilY family type IV pilus protein [Hydrogenophaga sp.]MDO9134770.1 PilC/PilY family type IV pilus protein [Hydrogenophaga sp.]
MNFLKHMAMMSKLSAVGLSGLVALASHALTIPNVPLSVQQSVSPLIMLVAGKDHRFFYEAYNDASDINGDGVLDIRYKPSITYLGLFSSTLCYTHNEASDNSGLFTPAGTAGAAFACPGQWSGNWLNYITTSRIDAMRVVLYGGTREVDSATSTILRRAYVPQDAHSWAKEYTSLAVDGYRISDYTPLSQPNLNRRHFFGNLTANAGVPCTDLNACSDLPPQLSVVTNSTKRVWEWASKERPVLDGSHGGTRVNRTVRVEVCKAGFTGGCKQYGTSYKPVGLLHEYGETNAMLFGMLTGSYDKSMSGGRLRKVISSFTNEVESTDGTFKPIVGIVRTFDRLRIRDFNNGRTDNSYRGGWVTTRAPNEGEFPDWGNPIGEMMYESLRYFAGKKSPTTAFMGTTTVDGEVGLAQAAWDDPYEATSAAKAAVCARGNMLVISDINTSYDSNQLPGVAPAFSTGFSGDLTGFSALTEANTISSNEPDVPGSRFIGQSGTSFDSAPSPKTITSLGNIRGLAPEEPTKQGSYYAASVAAFGKRTDLRTQTGMTGKQSVDTFVVALASPLPRIEIPMNGGQRVTLVPFAKSVSGSSISNAKGSYQPTNQIVDLYVEEIANSGSADANPLVNGGRYSAKFRINYEDVEQGADHDMDAIVEYTVKANADNTVTVILRPIYEAGGIQHRMGYIISGTSADGVYLEVQDQADQTPYFLNTPPGQLPGYCDKTPVPTDCNRLPYLNAPGAGDTATRTFSVGTTAAATLLKDPLWYAAKWGGLVDSNSNDKPDLTPEWDADGDGMPDTYFLVQNPLKLRESLKKTLDNIAARSSSASNVSANSTSISSSSRLYQAVFNTQRWSGDLVAYPATANGVGTTPSWQAAIAMPPWNERNVFMRTSGATTAKLTTFSNLSVLDQSALVDNTTFEYLLGRRTAELQNGGALRNRGSSLGDIVHSSPYYDRNTDVVYVGANDGMLHAFRGSDGRELFAFAPRQSIPRIKNLAATNYVHEYFVDGDVVVSDKTPASGNKSYLYSMLGRGGKGLFSLDVTTPTTFGTGSFLWEYTPQGNATAATDLDLGKMLGRPTIVKLNNGKLGLIAGNGYESTSGKAVLYIFIINTDGSLDQVKKIDTGISGDNGLAGPAAYDANNDGTADYIFAGDLKGNVWKFDVSLNDPAAWGKSYSGLPLFQARDELGAPQPITAPMYVTKNTKVGDPNRDKLFVFFGTGSYFKTGDVTDMQRQTWYGLIGDGATPINSSRAAGALRQRSVTATGIVGGLASRTFSLATPGDMVGMEGWYLDFTAPVVGERITTAAKIINFAVPGLTVSSMYPIPNDPCVPGGKGYLNVLDPFNGAAFNLGILDINRDNNFSNDTLTAANGVVGYIGSVDLGVGIPTEALPMGAPGRVIIFIGGSGDTGSAASGNDPATTGGLIKNITGLGATALKGRISWREIVRD